MCYNLVMNINKISNQLFEYTITHHIDIETLAKNINIPVNDLGRIQSENTHVSKKSIELCESFLRKNFEYYD